MVKNFINDTYFFEWDEATTAAYFKRITHQAPTLDSDEEPLFWPRMQVKWDASKCLKTLSVRTIQSVD
jgi:hypothetical protein